MIWFWILFCLLCVPSTVFAQNALNPDLSVIADFGYVRESNKKGSFQLREVELALQAPVDPFSRADFFVAFPKDEKPEIEEGTLTLLALPFGLQARLGKFNVDVGRMNRFHLHALPTSDPPLFLTSYFGEEGLKDSGISVSALLDNPWEIYSEARVEVVNGGNATAFSGRAQDAVTLARWKNFWDMGEDGGASFGLSYLQGRRGTEGGEAASFMGGDARYKWRPSKHRSFVLEGELLSASHAVNSTGYTLLGKYQFVKEMEVGIRYDGAGSLASDEYRQGPTWFATYLPTEFAFYRTQFKTLTSNTGAIERQLALQANFGIGVHGAHEF